MNVHFSSLSLLGAALWFCASCDSAEKSLHRAEQGLRIGEYAEAADAYKTAYRLTPATNKTERGRIAFLMGECYRRYGYSARALAAYRNAVRFKYADSTLLREAGAMMLLNGDYKNATTTFKDYLAAHPEDQALKTHRHVAPKVRFIPSNRPHSSTTIAPTTHRCSSMREKTVNSTLRLPEPPRKAISFRA